MNLKTVNLSNLPKFQNARSLKKGEKYWMGANAYYTEKGSNEKYYLTNPEIRTFRFMLELKTPEEQFHFLCLALLRHSEFYFIPSNKKLLKLWEELQIMFDDYEFYSPWNGNDKNLIPYDWIKYKIIDIDRGEFDFNEAKRFFEYLCSNQYVFHDGI